MRWIKQIRFPRSLEHVGNNYSRIFDCLEHEEMLIFIFCFKAMEIFHTTLMRIIVRVFILLFAEKKKRRRIKPRNKRYNGIFIILDIY